MTHPYYGRVAALWGLMAVAVSAAGQKSKAPEPIYPIPEHKQVVWQQRETTAFIHFGLNTFNNREWGYGNSKLKTFDPKKLDCEQWVRVLKAGGMKGVILTAKHHDGFCLWPTKLTEYCIRNTPYADGKGDIVGQLAAACRKYGLEFGVYLSPWDRNRADYGRKSYVEYFHAQLKELLTGYGKLFEVWFDGANGGDGWYGGAKEKRTIDRRTYYDFPAVYRMVDAYQPDAVIFGDGGPGCRWVGNEEGYAHSTNWSFLRSNTVYPGYPKYKELQTGHPDGDQWVPAECDVSIRPGWFWHKSENSKVKSAGDLTDLYYKSVGRNAELLLNVPVNTDGLISASDSASLVDFRKNIEAELADDILLRAKVKVSNKRSSKFGPKKINDGRYDTFWATADGVQSGEVSFTFKKPEKVNRLMLQEYIPLGQRVEDFTVLYEKDGQLVQPDIKEFTSTVGYKRLLRFPTIETRRLVVRFDKARGPLCINNISAFYANTPIARGEYGKKVDDVLPQTAAFVVEGLGKASAAKLQDRNAETATVFAGDTMKIDLGHEQVVNTLYYLPEQAFPPRGMVLNYRILVPDGGADTYKEVASGEFSNIVNNPIMQTVNFDVVKTRYVLFVATRTSDESHTIGAAEIAVK